MYKPFDLTGKVAIVTGGASGIGLGMAEAVAAAGSTVEIWDLDANRLKSAAGAINSVSGQEAATRLVDVGDEAQVVDAVQSAVSEHGRVDSLFANAGMSRHAPLIELEEADYRAVMRTNLEGVLWTFREVARHIIHRAAAGDPGGSLIATSSLAAISGSPRNYPYTAAKAGVTAVVRAAAVELARYDVRANAILPGWISTGLTERHQESDMHQDLIKRRVPARRWGRGEDFGGIAVYLMSDASAFHTGQSFVIDGGYSVF